MLFDFLYDHGEFFTGLSVYLFLMLGFWKALDILWWFFSHLHWQ